MGLRAVIQQVVSFANQTFSNPTFTGVVTGAPYYVGGTAIPFIGLSSGSVAANGAISGITALPRAYPNAYCYFPANALATTIAAGWYYCTFSTTTAGVAFLDTYTSGMPAIPASPTAVTDGKGAFTGDTGEEFGPTFTLAANSLGVNGSIQAYANLECANNANAKTHRLRWTGNAGTVLASLVATSTTGVRGNIVTSNRGATNVQETTMIGQTNAATGVTGAATTSAIDSTASTTLVTSIQRATATDNFVIANVQFWATKPN